MTQLVREDPPRRSTSHDYNWDQIAADCKSNPGMWFKVFEQDRWSYATAIQSSSIRALRRDRGFQAKTANNRWRDEDDVRRRYCTLYIRYDPSQDSREEQA